MICKSDSFIVEDCCDIPDEKFYYDYGIKQGYLDEGKVTRQGSKVKLMDGDSEGDDETKDDKKLNDLLANIREKASVKF